jgi:hypothetical protein
VTQIERQGFDTRRLIAVFVELQGPDTARENTWDQLSTAPARMEYRAPHGALHQKGNLCSLTRREATIYQITRDGTCRGDNDALLAQYWLLMNKDGHTLVSVLIDGHRHVMHEQLD